MRPLLVAGAAVAVLAAGAGLVKYAPRPVPETGFVAVKTTVPTTRGDAFLLGDTTLEALNRGTPAEGTFAGRVGPTKLQLRRAGQVHDLCEIQVRQNRITTVTVVAQNNRIACRIET